jgi:hypothetical protein
MSDVILPIWPGSSSFFPGDTPYGFYDYDQTFQCDIDATADWCAKRLGYGLSDVELQDTHFYAAFEEAVNEYGNLINTYAARDYILNLMGVSTGSNVNLSQTYISPTLQNIFEMAREYGNEIPSGGTLTWYSGSITITPGKQIYDLKSASIETGSFNTDKFTIRKIFHDRTPASTRYLDPNFGSDYVLDQFGFGGYTIAGSYLLMPLSYDIQRMQAIEFNDEIRKSSFSFQLTNNRLRIFPIPTDTFKMWFLYTLNDETYNQNVNGAKDKISGHSDIPYSNVTYSRINAIGKQWIRKYCLAICKEILGYIRGKYASVPIADGEVTLNGADLLSAGKEERDALTADLKETLDQMSRQSQLERKAAEAENLNNQLKWTPMKIYIG